MIKLMTFSLVKQGTVTALLLRTTVVLSFIPLNLPPNSLPEVP